MNKYFKILGTIEGREEMLFGSFDKTDIEYELEAEKEGWKNEGYKKIRVTTDLTDKKPHSMVYGKDFKPETV